MTGSLKLKLPKYFLFILLVEISLKRGICIKKKAIFKNKVRLEYISGTADMGEGNVVYYILEHPALKNSIHVLGLLGTLYLCICAFE